VPPRALEHVLRQIARTSRSASRAACAGGMTGPPSAGRPRSGAGGWARCPGRRPRGRRDRRRARAGVVLHGHQVRVRAGELVQDAADGRDVEVVDLVGAQQRDASVRRTWFTALPAERCGQVVIHSRSTISRTAACAVAGCVLHQLTRSHSHLCPWRTTPASSAPSITPTASLRPDSEPSSSARSSAAPPKAGPSCAGARPPCSRSATSGAIWRRTCSSGARHYLARVSASPPLEVLEVPGSRSIDRRTCAMNTR